MPKFYCEYCGIYLTHSSPSGRSQHAKGRKHINNRIEYYKQVIEDLIKENSDKQKQMQSGQSISNHPQPMYPGAFQNLHQLPLLQLNQLKAGGIQQVQINSTQQQGNAPPLQPPLPILQPPFINMPKPGGPAMPPNVMPPAPPGNNIPPMRPGQQPPLGPPLGVPQNPNMIQPGLIPPAGMKPLPGMPPMGPPPVGMMPPPGAPQMMGVPPNMPPMGMMPPPHHLGPALLNSIEHNKGEYDDRK